MAQIGDSLTWNDLKLANFLLYNSIFVLTTDLLLYPADLLTTRLQVDKISSSKVKIHRLFKEIFHREGIRGLFRGFEICTISHFPGQFLYYSSYEYANQKLRDILLPSWHIRKDFLCNGIAGAFAEAISAIAYVPADIITQRLQVSKRLSFVRSDKNQTVFTICRHIHQTEGLGGFFRGYGPYLLVHAPSSAIWWSSYEATKALLFKALRQLGSDESLLSKVWLQNGIFCLSGSMAGGLSYAATNPLEVAKTRLQLMEVGQTGDKAAIKSGFYRILLNIYQREGIGGLFKGLKPRLLLRVPMSAVTFTAYEYMKGVSIIQE